MTLRFWVTWIGLFAFAGCGKDIGDSCESVNECISTDIDRLCLTQDGEGFPGGYCTKFNCGGSNACPEEATCVAYRSTLGGGACDVDTSLSRLQRNYCMLRCEQDSDCRSGYRCLSADGNNPLGALIIDGHVGAKICTLSYDEPQASPDRASEVCEPAGLREPDADAGSITRDAAGDVATSDAAMSDAATSDAAGDAATSDAAGGVVSSSDSVDSSTPGLTTNGELSSQERQNPDAALVGDASIGDASGE
jgi:hypothetical protein